MVGWGIGLPITVVPPALHGVIVSKPATMEVPVGHGLEEPLDKVAGGGIFIPWVPPPTLDAAVAAGGAGVLSAHGDLGEGPGWRVNHSVLV
jgi:hypothetical protein